VKVERPTGRTTFATRARSGRLWCATRAERIGHPGAAWVQGRSPGRRRLVSGL
jgi:hypothetical protein